MSLQSLKSPSADSWLPVIAPRVPEFKYASRGAGSLSGTFLDRESDRKDDGCSFEKDQGQALQTELAGSPQDGS